MCTVLIRIGSLADGGWPVEVFQDHEETQARHSGWLHKPEVDGARGGTAEFAAARSVLRHGPYDPQRADQARRLLLGLLESSGVLTAWKAISKSCSHPGALRTLVEAADPVWSELPWELLELPGSLPGGRDSRLGHAVHQRLRSLAPVHRPLRVLIVLGSPTDQELRSEAEVAAIQGALRGHPGEWHVEVLRGPSSVEFYDTVTKIRPHILHFIGHGGLDLYGRTVLRFRGEDEDQEPWHLTAQDIRVQLPADTLRLVVLHACDTSVEDRPDASPILSPIAEGFLAIGVGALVTMQGEIASDLAVHFSAALYQALAQEQPVDEAVWSARKALARRGNGFDDRDWALARLMLAAWPHRVLHRAPGGDREQAAGLFAIADTRLHLAVDRAAERRELFGGFTPFEPYGPRRRLTVVRGGADTGKTFLVRSCLLSWHLNGGRTAYVDFNDEGRTRDWLGAVRHLCERVGQEVGADSREALAEFRHRLVHRRRGQSPPGGPPWLQDDGGPWEPEADAVWPYRNAELLFGELLQALAACAGPNRRLTLVLDGLHGLAEGALADFLMPHLIEPVLADQESPLRLIVVEDDGAQERARLPRPSRPHPVVHLEGFRVRELRHISGEHIVACQVHDEVRGIPQHEREERSALLQEIWQPCIKGNKPTTSPNMLALLEKLVETRSGH
ncbi:CHAT domain-containing protein [Kitasatospora azatica]|uniref:CHAT domain-containing protein n=1 Tax=Kitasatospora azatica TaxID=58347 RepID=UPI000567260C|nr:CHAT domain-containing protein [Kitasatospora azatica]